MNIKQFGNNKAVAVYDGKTDWLFSYGTLILSRDRKKDTYFRHFNNESLLSATTMKHIKEFLGYESRFYNTIQDRLARERIMALPYKENN